MEEGRKTSYWFDKDDIIVRVCSNWDHFALNNEEGNLLRLDHIVERLEDREKPVYFEHANVAEVAFRCSVCGQVYLKGKWYEPDDRSALQYREQGKFIVAYTVCDHCRISGY